MRDNRMDENVTIVYTAYITLRNGHRLYAKQYGKKAFELHIRDNKHRKRKYRVGFALLVFITRRIFI